MNYAAPNGNWATIKISALPVPVREEAAQAAFCYVPYGVSPEDLFDRVHFVAVDIDDDDFALLKAILRILPHSRRHPIWPTRSGGRGYHLWLFPQEPIARQRLKPFLETLAEAIAAECGDGAAIEIFPHPNGHGPRPLRWFGLPHPETGEPETIIDVRHPRKRDPYDTRLLLEALRDGFGRVPAEALRPEALRRRRALVATNGRCARPAGALQAPGGAVLDLLLRDHRFVSYVARLLGLEFGGPGRPVNCPAHPPDQHPSASWIQSRDGAIAIFCHHGAGVLDLPALLALHETGGVKRLHGMGRKDLLLRHAHASGLLGRLTEELIQHNTHALRRALRAPGTDPLNGPLGGSVPGGGFAAVLQLWQILCDFFRRNAEAGRATALAPARKLAELTGLRVQDACAGLNYLAALGLIRKLPRGPHRAQAVVLLLADPEEVLRRARLLGSWRACTRRKVAAALGEAAAREVFVQS